MFTSEYEHTIDSKSRLFIPAKYREFVGSSVLLNKWFDGNLYFMTIKGWEEYKDKVLEKLSPTKDRDILRRLFGWAMEVSLDSQGRILIPPPYMEYAKLTDKAIIVGCGKRAEIWAPEVWRAHNNTVDDQKILEALCANEL